MNIFISAILLLFLACAPSHYHRQLSQLNPEKQKEYRVLKYSIEAVGRQAEIEEFNKIVSTDSLALKQFEEAFWKKRDPNPLTSVNEKKEEFHRRLQFVLENFSTNNYFRPWDERGDTYLKLGEPNERLTRMAKKYSYLPLSQAKKEEVSEENWAYMYINSQGGPLKLRFQQDLIRGYVSVPESASFGRDQQRQQQMVTWVSQVEQKPMQYFYDYGKEELRYAFGLTPFLIRESPNIYDIYLTINAPAKKLITPSLDSIHYVWKVLVQDENYERLFTDSSEGLSYLGSREDIDELMALDQKELRLKAGTYIITSELVNSAGNKGGMLQSKLVLPPYKFPQEIEVSKAILAKEVRVADSTDFKFVRNGLVIKPWVSSVFTLGEPLWLYFEIYNMPLDREGESHFKLTYYLQDLLTDKRYEVLEKDLRQAQRDFAIVQSFTDSLFQEAKIPIKTGKDYVLLTEIKDEVLGKKVQSLSAMFKFKKS